MTHGETASVRFLRPELPLRTIADKDCARSVRLWCPSPFPDEIHGSGQPVSFCAITPSTARANVLHRRARDSAARCPAGVSA